MRLYLVQHGEARSEDVDPERRLTEKGSYDVEAVASFLAPRALGVTAVWHSGKARARETAEILAGRLAGSPPVTARQGLNPNDPVAALAETLEVAGSDLMIVGHLPFLAKLTGLLVCGDAVRPAVAFRYGATVCLSRDATAGWRVVWMVTPELVAS
jgi:phosphohistidine phosphatase